jgi:hypothetical protein
MILNLSRKSELLAAIKLYGFYSEDSPSRLLTGMGEGRWQQIFENPNQRQQAKESLPALERAGLLIPHFLFDSSL